MEQMDFDRSVTYMVSRFSKMPTNRPDVSPFGSDSYYMKGRTKNEVVSIRISPHGSVLKWTEILWGTSVNEYN